MRGKTPYDDWLDEEERKLRWLIGRQPKAVELRCYLVFLLVANQRYAKALKECEEILKISPSNLMALVWNGVLEAEITETARCSILPRRRRIIEKRKVWRHARCGRL
ncbi:MAG: hypothetical protein C4293_05450 [Nitrospiraceae bacterium]